MKRLPMYLLWMQRREGSERAWQIIRGLGERNPQQVAVAGKGAKRVFVSQGETCSVHQELIYYCNLGAEFRASHGGSH